MLASDAACARPAVADSAAMNLPTAADDAADPAAAEDGALMASFARGEASAFDRLYARHHAALYRFIRRVLGRDAAAQADEVFQDTWLRVVHARARWSAQGATFRTWLFTIAQNRAIDLLRRSGREVSIDDDAADAPPYEPDATAWAGWPAAPGGAPDAGERLFWRRAGERLLACLEELPVAQKVAFLLHHEEGLGLQDLARALAVPAETAKSRLRYAMTKLRACMGAYLPAAKIEAAR